MGDFSPKSIFNINNQDGTTSTAEEWDLGDVGSGSYIPGPAVGVVFMVGALFPIAAPLLLILCMYTFYGKPLIINIVGFVVSSYVLIDMHNHWIGTHMYELILATVDLVTKTELDIVKILEFTVFFNVLALVGHLLYYLGGAIIGDKFSKVILIMYVLCLSLSIFFSRYLIENMLWLN